MTIGFVSTFPPTRCGLATFTAALCDAVGPATGSAATVVRVLAAGETPTADDGAVAGHLIAGDRRSQRGAAETLNRSDVAVIQHEFGIYGGRDGAEIIGLLQRLTVPAIVVLHTVLASPSAHQRLILESICGRASSVVVMTRHAQETLRATIAVPAHKVQVIPHGARVPQTSPRIASVGGRPTLLTWGLISPGKGLEWSIRAVAELAASGTPVDYVIAGQTHPKLVAQHGEGYRESLTALVQHLGLDDRVSFVDRYLTSDALDGLIGNADAVVLPYESAEQATSGVLAEAVAARRPVIATGFPHAIELLSGGAGFVVPHRDPRAIADAVAVVIDRRRSLPTGRADVMSWSAVGASYARIIHSLRAERAA